MCPDCPRFCHGLRIQTYQPGFGQTRQDNPRSGLYAFAPDAVEGEDWLPEIYTGFMDADPGAAGALQSACARYDVDALVLQQHLVVQQ